MVMRQDGFYWVRKKGLPLWAEPYVAQWLDGLWHTTGTEAGDPDHEFVCLSGPLPPPKQPGSTPVEEPSLAVPHLPPRRVVQLSVRSEGSETWPAVFAVCNDGTLWMFAMNSDKTLSECTWRQLPEVPQ